MSNTDNRRHAFVWGWLRLLLGIAQMSLSLAALLAFITSGLSAVTWALCGVATAASLTSRFLYRGRPAPVPTDTGGENDPAKQSGRQSHDTRGNGSHTKTV